MNDETVTADIPVCISKCLQRGAACAANRFAIELLRNVCSSTGSGRFFFFYRLNLHQLDVLAKRYIVEARGHQETRKILVIKKGMRGKFKIDRLRSAQLRTLFPFSKKKKTDSVVLPLDI